MSKIKLIIDTDPGIDDAFGIAFASLYDKAEILCLTVVNGNATLENCAINAKLIVDKVFDGIEKPPIYIGAKESILKNIMPSEERHYYGPDGLTDTTNGDYKAEVEIIRETFLKEKYSSNDSHAALKIIDLVNKYPNEITILALGPLTNLALALKLSHNPDQFTQNIKKLYIMGGSEPKNFSKYPDSSNEVNYPEFNFRVDPIAAKIVFDKFKCPILLFTFDSCLRSFHMPTTELKEEFDKYTSISKRCNFLANIALTHRIKVPNPHIYRSCDLLAAIGTFYPDECKMQTKRLGTHSIEIGGHLNGIFKHDDSVDETRDIELCIDMDLNATVGFFKLFLAKLAKLDGIQKN